MKRSTQWVIVIGVVVGLPVATLATWTGWEIWRARTLLAFCKEVHVGMPLTQFLERERAHWVNDSYVVQSVFPGFVDQAHTKELEFRSHIYDPDFACFYTHDGKVITNAQILP